VNSADVIKETIQEWMNGKATQYAAALSFYTLLALAPLLLVAVAGAGLIYGPGAARNALLTQIHERAGVQVADAVRTILTSAHQPSAGTMAFIIAGIVLLLGASRALAMLRTAFNAIWNVPQIPRKGFLNQLRSQLATRLLNVILALGFGTGLLALLAASAVWSWVAGQMRGSLPAAELVLRAADFVVTLGLLTILFATLFRFVANARPDWADLWLGAFITAGLFNIGRLAIGLYLGHSATTSSFGAAGSVIALLLWMYYSALIIFFGAAFTQVYLRRHGRQLHPKDDPQSPSGTER
jgi:membrane protein